MLGAHDSGSLVGTQDHPTIVVAYDRSRLASTAVQWANDLTVRLGGRLTVVWVWRLTDVWSQTLAGHDFVSVPPITEHQATATRLLSSDIHELIGPGAHIHCKAVEGEPVHQLLAESSAADILVLGSRGHGPLGTVFLGSVSAACVQQSTMPVTIIPHRMRARAKPDEFEPTEPAQLT